jgi:hypothetical protein
MIRTEKTIEYEFLQHGVYLGDVFLIQGDYVLEYAKKLIESGFVILGLEAFKKMEGGYLPLLDKIADYTMILDQSAKLSKINTLEATERFLNDFENFKDYFFSITSGSVELN